MAIPSIDNRRSYSGNGVQTVFAFPLRFAGPEDLLVILRGANGEETQLVRGTDYTVTGAGEPEGGGVTMTVPPAIGTKLVLIGNVLPLQPLDLQDGGPLPAKSVNRSFDRQAMATRRLWDHMGRTLSLRETDDKGAGAFDAGGNRLTGLAPATSDDEAVTRGQVTTIVDSIYDPDITAPEYRATPFNTFASALAAASDGKLSASVEAVLVGGHDAIADGGDGGLYSDFGSQEPTFGPFGSGKPTATPRGAAFKFHDPTRGRWFGLSTWEKLPWGKCGIQLNNASLDQTAAFDAMMQSGKIVLGPPGARVRVEGQIKFYASGQRIEGCGRSGFSSTAQQNHTVLISGTNADFRDWICIGDKAWDSSQAAWAAASTFTDCGLSHLFLDTSAMTQGNAWFERKTSRSRFEFIYANTPWNLIRAEDWNTTIWTHIWSPSCRGEYNWLLTDRWDGANSDAGIIAFCNVSGTTANPNTKGIVMDGDVAGVQMLRVAAQKVGGFLHLKAGGMAGNAANRPSSIRAHMIGGDNQCGPLVYAEAVTDLRITTGHFNQNTGATTDLGEPGVAVYIGAECRHVTLTDCLIGASDKEGVVVAGTDTKLIGNTIYQNGQAAADTYANIRIDPSADGVLIAGNTIGINSSTSRGRTSWAIDNAEAAQNVIIDTSNDLRGNKRGGISRPWAVNLRGGIPLGQSLNPDAGGNLIDNGTFLVNQMGLAAGTLGGRVYFLDRWRSGASGGTYTINSDGTLLLGSGSSFVQVLARADLASKPVCVCIKAMQPAASSTSLTITLGSQTVALPVPKVASPSTGAEVPQWQWYIGHFNLTAADTGRINLSIATGSVALQIAEVRANIGDVPDIYSAPRTPDADLAACRRWRLRIQHGVSSATYAMGRADTTTTGVVALNYGGDMAGSPTATFNGTWSLAYGATAVDVTLAGTSAATRGAGMMDITATADSAVLTVGDGVALKSKSATTSYIDLVVANS